MRETTHDDARAALTAAALDALAPEEQAAVLAHAEQCPTCGPELAELRATMATLSFAVPPIGADADVDARLARIRGRLLSRVRAQPDGARTQWWLVGALAASLVLAAILWRGNRMLARTLADAQSEAARSHAALDSTTIALTAAERQLDVVTSPQAEVITLTAAGARAQASALVVRDPSTQLWSVYARNMPAIASDRTYEMWLITKAGKKIPAGTFNPAPGGSAHLETTSPLTREDLSAIAITEEPAGGVQQPTGPIVILGAAGRPGR